MVELATTTPESSGFRNRAKDAITRNIGHTLYDTLIKNPLNAIGAGLGHRTVEGFTEAQKDRVAGGFINKTKAVSKALIGVLTTPFSLLNPLRWVDSGVALLDNSYRAILMNPVARLYYGVKGDTAAYQAHKLSFAANPSLFYTNQTQLQRA